MTKWIYWAATSLVGLFLFSSSLAYLFSQSMIDGLKSLGFPNFFRIELAVLKLMALVVILLPAFPLRVKEWAYAGVAIFLVTAIVAHVAHRDSHWVTLANLLLLGVLAVSNIYLHKLAAG